MSEEVTTAVAVRNRSEESLPLRTMADIVQAGSLLAQSGMFGIKSDGAGFVVVATCQQQGISLMDFLRMYHIVDGKPSMRADAMLAEFRKRGAKYAIVDNSETRAAMDVTFEGKQYSFEYTMQDAMQTGDCFKADGKTVKDIWKKRPADMLWARLGSRTVRRLCPEINAGLYTPEEVSDFDGGDAQNRVPGAPPTPLATAEAEKRSKRAKKVTEAVVVEQTPEPEPDATLCPIGDDEFKGKPWTEFPDEMLEAVLSSDDPALRPAHKAAVRIVLDERKDATEGGAA